MQWQKFKYIKGAEIYPGFIYVEIRSRKIQNKRTHFYLNFEVYYDAVSDVFSYKHWDTRLLYIKD